MSANRKEPDFVVTDRRKFTEEGVRREEAPESAPEIPAADTARVVSEKFSKEDVERQTGRVAPSEAEQAAQHSDYRAGSQRLDDLLQERTGQRAAAAEMTFERLVASLYMTAMMQLGMMVPEGEEPRIDILGARQTIEAPVRGRFSESADEPKAQLDRSVMDAVVEQTTRERAEQAGALRDRGLSEEARKLFAQNAAELQAYLAQSKVPVLGLLMLSDQYNDLAKAAPASPSQWNQQRKALRQLNSGAASVGTRY